MIFLIVWFIIGILTTGWIYYQDYKDGVSITIGLLSWYIFWIFLGVISAIITISALINYDKIIIKRD